MEFSLLIYSTILSFSGFVLAFYGVLAQTKIDKITANNLIDYDNDQQMELLAIKYDKWKAGSYFVSNKAVSTGIIISLIACILNFIINPWWSSALVLIIGYFLYLILANILGSLVQFLAILTALIAIISIPILLL